MAQCSQSLIFSIIEFEISLKIGFYYARRERIDLEIEAFEILFLLLKLDVLN
jgi:hypothetical protein